MENCLIACPGDGYGTALYYGCLAGVYPQSFNGGMDNTFQKTIHELNLPAKIQRCNQVDDKNDEAKSCHENNQEPDQFCMGYSGFHELPADQACNTVCAGKRDNHINPFNQHH